MASLLMQGERSLISLVVATSLPAAASLLLLFVALMVPGIYAVGRLAYPLNFTLPVIHSSIVFMLAELTRGSFGLEKPPQQLEAALRWDNLSFLVLCLMFQIVMFSLLAMRSNSRPQNPTAEAQR